MRGAEQAEGRDIQFAPYGWPVVKTKRMMDISDDPFILPSNYSTPQLQLLQPALDPGDPSTPGTSPPFRNGNSREINGWSSIFITTDCALIEVELTSNWLCRSSRLYVGRLDKPAKREQGRSSECHALGNTWAALRHRQ
ncbi:hypothetical protein CC2G_008652 [Coprinopsis cinerea AmutBmut pab1-1]|nr:hypothetical protein CC2G_008652 [Coprinopsis cinerea AmutBmut pab1-1]